MDTSKTIGDMIKEYNELADQHGRQNLKSWKKGRDKLQERIDALRSGAPAENLVDGAPADVDVQDEVPAAVEVISEETIENTLPPAPAPEIEHEVIGEETAEELRSKLVHTVVARPKKRTVKASALEWLQHVVSTTDNGETIGLPYDAILAKVKEECPVNRPTLVTIRWYQTMVVTGKKGYEGVVLPTHRPRIRKS